MVLHSYQEMYLSKAQVVLGEAFDYAINTCKIPGGSFIKEFVVSSVSKKMENGEPAYLAGKSGIEIAADVVAETTGKELTEKPTDRFDRSTEYWIGWAIAYYQWRSGRKYSAIFRAFDFDELRKMYYTLHEADVSKFADIADERMRKLFPEMNLKRIRTVYGCTQAELAKESGVSLRSIQMSFDDEDGNNLFIHVNFPELIYVGYALKRKLAHLDGRKKDYDRANKEMQIRYSRGEKEE